MNFVAFSGGLDSTWIMNDLLSKGEIVIPVQVNVGAVSTQLLPETLARRAMLIEFNKLYPGLIHNEVLIPNQSMYQIQTRGTGVVPGTTYDPSRCVDTLIQQISVRNAIIMTKYAVGNFGDKFFAGWHKDDVDSTFSETLYDHLANPEQEERIYTLIDKYSSGKPLKIQLPCWDLDKREMWDSLPKIIQQWVIAGSRPSITINDETVTITQNGYKVNEYSELGIELSHQQHKLDLLPIDHYFLHNTNIDELGDLPDFKVSGFEWYGKLLDYLRDNKHKLRKEMHLPFGKDIKLATGVIVKSIHFKSERDRWSSTEITDSKVWTNEYPRETDSRTFTSQDIPPPGLAPRAGGRVDAEIA